MQTMATDNTMAAPALILVGDMARAAAWEREIDGEASRGEWHEKTHVPLDVRDVNEEFGEGFYSGLVDSLFADVGGLDEIDALLRIPSDKATVDVTDAAEEQPAVAEAEAEPARSAVSLEAVEPDGTGAVGGVSTGSLCADESSKEEEEAWEWDIKLEPVGRNGFRAVRVRVPVRGAGAAAPAREWPGATAKPVVVVAVPAWRAQQSLHVVVPAAAQARARAASPTSVMMVELSPAAKVRRSAALVRWRAKRKRRQFGRVVYKRRKVIAHARPRKGGRFVKTSETRWVSAAQL